MSNRYSIIFIISVRNYVLYYAYLPEFITQYSILGINLIRVNVKPNYEILVCILARILIKYYYQVKGKNGEVIKQKYDAILNDNKGNGIINKNSYRRKR